MAGTKEWCDIMGITEQIERKKAAEAAKTEYENNLQSAMANLAKGSKSEPKGEIADE